MIRVGRLGNLQLQPGFYVYIGSALGSGGVRGRLGHHMQHAERPHWHIDYLRAKTTIVAVWFRYHRKSLEHAWARRFAALPGASVPMAGFGSSDCDCESHLFYFKDGVQGTPQDSCTRCDGKLRPYLARLSVITAIPLPVEAVGLVHFISSPLISARRF